MATARSDRDPRLAAQGAVLKAWGQEWRAANGMSQQDLGRSAGYGSEASPKSAAVAISRIESGKTNPTGRYRQRLLFALGHEESELEAEIARISTEHRHSGNLLRVMTGAVHQQNEMRQRQIIASSNKLSERVVFQLSNFEETIERAQADFVLPFLESAARVDFPTSLTVPEVSSSNQRFVLHEHQIMKLRGRTLSTLLETLAHGGLGLITGAGLGSASAAGIFISVSSWASASTGTSIASLSGVAASNATLAWLGGGSLTAGGRGIAGGAAVLTSVAALPALLAVGGVLVWKGRKLRAEAEAEWEKLDAAQQALEDMWDALESAETWNGEQQRMIQRAELIGRTIQVRHIETALSDFEPTATGSHRIAWETLSVDVQESLAVQLRLLSLIIEVQALPVWLSLQNVNQPDLDATQEETSMKSGEWIKASLQLAQIELDEHENWVRSRMARDPIS